MYKSMVHYLRLAETLAEGETKEAISQIRTKVESNLTVEDKVVTQLERMSDPKLLNLYNEFASESDCPFIYPMDEINFILEDWTASDILRSLDDHFDISYEYFTIDKGTNTLNSAIDVKDLIKNNVEWIDFIKWVAKNKHKETTK